MKEKCSCCGKEMNLKITLVGGDKLCLNCFFKDNRKINGIEFHKPEVEGGPKGPA